MEFTRNNENREFHAGTMKNQPIMPEDLDETAQFAANETQETDLYPNTITGNQVSAAARNESFDDPDYGATGQRTRKDIMNEMDTEEE